MTNLQKHDQHFESTPVVMKCAKTKQTLQPFDNAFDAARYLGKSIRMTYKNHTVSSVTTNPKTGNKVYFEKLKQAA